MRNWWYRYTIIAVVLSTLMSCKCDAATQIVIADPNDNDTLILQVQLDKMKEDIRDGQKIDYIEVDELERRIDELENEYHA